MKQFQFSIRSEYIILSYVDAYDLATAKKLIKKRYKFKTMPIDFVIFLIAGRARVASAWSQFVTERGYIVT